MAIDAGLVSIDPLAAYRQGYRDGTQDQRERIAAELGKILVANVVWPQALADELYGLFDNLRGVS